MGISRELQHKIERKIQEIDSVADDMPGVVIIHSMVDLSIVYMSRRGLTQLGVTLEELIKMGPEYYNRFFNQEEAKEQVPKMIGLLERNNDNELVALFQQVKLLPKHSWVWHCTSVKILMRDDEGKPLLTIAIAIPIDPEHHLTHKVIRLLEENNFLRQNGDRFAQLSKREKIILKHLALGKTSMEIAEEIHISSQTVDTHRKNIKQKLETSSPYELAQYARAFDLI